jgi:peptidylprolyl isomerase
VIAAPTDARRGSARRLSAAALTGLLVLVLGALVGACGSGTSRKPSSLEDKVRVSGKFGEKPKITIAAPLRVAASTSWTLIKGDRDTLRPDSTTILQLSLADTRTGKTLISTADPGQRPIEANLSDQLFPSLIKALTGAKAGSRLVVASTARDSYGTQGNAQLGIKAGDPVVMVADILSSDPASVLPGPTGASAAAPSRAPRIRTSGKDPVGVDVSGLTKPTKAAVYTLREGTGRTLAGPRRIAADYLGQVWGAKTPFDSSYSKEPARFSIGVSGVVPCWDEALAGVKAGARVLLVCPPATAYGKQAQPHIPANSTLVFLIDVLGVG